MKYEIYNKDIIYKIMVNASLMKSFTSAKKINKNINTNTDLCYKLEAIYAFLKNEYIESYCEPMAGLGFSASLVQAMYPNASMILNDISVSLFEHLKSHFPQEQIYNDDVIEQIDWTLKIPRVDCLFSDHNHFTFNHDTCFLERALKKTKKIFIYTDVFPYSLKPFDRSKLNDYIRRVKAFFHRRGKYVDSVYLYPSRNVMMLKVVNNFTTTKFLGRSDNIITIKKIQGLGL
jgi:hypothetical protein